MNGGEAFGALAIAALHFAGDVEHGDAIDFAATEHVGGAVKEFLKLGLDVEDADIGGSGGRHQIRGRQGGLKQGAARGILDGQLQCTPFPGRIAEQSQLWGFRFGLKGLRGGGLRNCGGGR